jgi:NADH-quinone oxidoreductase subunit N
MVTAIDFQLTAPALILTLGALLVLLAEVTVKSEKLRNGITFLSLLAAFIAPICCGKAFTTGATAFGGFIYGDSFAWLANMMITGGSLMAFVLGFRSLDTQKIQSKGEYYSLLLMSIVGALVLVTARELILLFVGLEIMSIALYTLSAFNLWSSRSSEAGLKYFLMGSMFSAIFLYGIALLYGLSGSLMIPDVANWVVTDGASAGVLLLIALGFVFVGFAFKIGLAPFHFWVPDVYQGAPTVVTAFMACVIKSAAVLVALRGMWVIFGEPTMMAQWADLLWVVAALTMTVGNLIALRQRGLKRMLAYSSISHAGYMAVALLAPGINGGAAIIFYLVAYMVMTFGAFAVVMTVAETAKEGEEGDSIERFNGLGLKYPMVGILMTIFMFSLAGLPPGFAGFLGKFYVFSAAVEANYIGLVIIGVINSAISCYYYLRVLVAMYFTKGEPAPLNMKAPAYAVMVVCAILAVFLGLFPGRLHNVGSDAIDAIKVPVGVITK